MNIVAVDDERLARAGLMLAVAAVFQDAELMDFEEAESCMKYVTALREKGETLQYAFLDIQLGEINGIDLAKKLKDIFPDTRIVFVTAYNNYASEAFSVCAKGYILKPIDEKTVREALDNMEGDWRAELEKGEPKQLYVSTFGRFYAAVDGEPLVFERSKSRELLALLIDRKGRGVTNAEIEDILWEDASGEKRKSGYVQKIIASMMKELKQKGVEKVIDKRRNYLAIKPELVICDFYEFLKGSAAAVNTYHGVYLEEYSWAEFRTGMITSQKREY